MRGLRFLSQAVTLLLGATVLTSPNGHGQTTPKRFTDVTARCGIDVSKDRVHGFAIEDFDGDGRLDIITVSFDPPYVRYFRNRGRLRFEEATQGSGLRSFRGRGTGAAVGDFDRDGKLDVYLASLDPGASRLFRGLGNGRFVDMTDRAGLAVDTPARSCAWSDIDGDGWLDLFVCNPRGPNHLFRNNGDGTFRDIAIPAGVAFSEYRSLGCAFGDIDGDGKDDLFIANYQSQHSKLMKNLGGGRFRDITATAGVLRKASTVGCVFADVYNRGVLDLYVTTDSWMSGYKYTEEQLKRIFKFTVEPNLLYRNDGRGRFSPDPASILRHKTLSHDATLEDLDHDGWIDIYVGVDAIPTGNRFATHKGGNPLWTRPDGKHWRQVRDTWGVGHQANCCCVPAADFDNDGDLDLLLSNFYSNVVLYRNNANDRNWLRIRVVGHKTHPNGIGTQVRLYSLDGRLLAMRHIQSGTGYARSGPLEAHFGLGPAAQGKKYKVEVYFPASGRRVWRLVAPATRLTIHESDHDN